MDQLLFNSLSWTMLSQFCVLLCKNILVAIVVFVIGKFVIKKIVAAAKAVMQKKNVEAALQGFIGSIIEVSLYLCLAIIIISILGIETSSFIALFTSAGVAVGMALSGTLQNFAGGVMILLFKPFKIGDYIVAQGYEGVVKDIQIFNTILVSLDNQTIIIPNGGLSTGSMKNLSKQKYRRVDVNFQFAYGTDYMKVREEILAIMNANDMILKAPIEGEPVDGPWTGLAALGESGVTIATRAWCETGNYWAVAGYMNQAVYQELKDKGFMFPFNKLDVIVKNK